MSKCTAVDLLASTRAARRSGDVLECMRLAEACVGTAERENDAHSAFHALTAVGALYVSRSEPNEALPFLKAAMERAHSGSLVSWLAHSYHNLFVAHRDARDLKTALRYARTALELHADRGEKHRVALLVADMQEGYLSVKPSPELARNALHCWRAATYNVSTPRERVIARVNAMGAAALLRNRTLFYEAADGFQEALCKCAEDGNAEGVGWCLCEASVAAARMADFARAARLAADALLIARERSELVIAEMAGEARMAAAAERVPAALWN